jgi:ribonuclease HII
MSAEASLSVTTLTPEQIDAARLVANDDQSDQAIADTFGITKRTLYRWKARPDFAALVAEERENFRQRIFRAGFADKARRVRALDVVAGAVLNQLQRAEFQTIVKVTDDGEHIYGFDKDRLREFREYLDDIAEEMGDRQAKGNPAASVVVKVYTDARLGGDSALEAEWHDAPPARSSADR